MSLVELKNFNFENIKNTFEWIKDKELRELFCMRGEPIWEVHVEYFNKKLKNETEKVFAIYSNNKHVGNCGIKNITNYEAEVWIYIGVNCEKHKGIGTNAMNLLFLEAQKLKLDKLYLYVLDYNTNAIKLYRKTGFEDVEMTTKDKELWQDRGKNIIKIEKNLNKDKHYFIVAGSTLQYNLVQKVKERGFLVHIFDYDTNCRCREIADYFHEVSIEKKEEILEIAKKYNPVAITTTACEIGNISACYAAEKLGLNSNSYETALDTTDKSRMKKIFEKHNLPNAKYIKIKSIDEVNIDKLKFPLIIKPSDRSAGRGVTRVDKKEDFKQYFDLALKESINKIVLIEEILEGQQFSIETVSCGGKHQIAAFTEEYLDGSINYIETQQMIPARLNNENFKELEKLTYKILDAFNIKYGCCHIEVKLTDEGFKIIEAASRIGGWRDVLIKYAYNDDFNNMLIDSTLGKYPVIEHKGKNCALVKLIYNKKEYEFYKKVKKETPEVIVHDEVKEYSDYKAVNLAQAKGFYYIVPKKNEDIDYYIKATI